ncbi:cytochrome C [Massilia sp. W12]|uniref:cytochrome C n=1 Tax=Massilia sp. W12 TaxID=3126507 RepID=UPI0030CA9958
MKNTILRLSGLALLLCQGGASAQVSTILQPFPNAAGNVQTFSTTGAIDPANPFFKPFGNGRSCASCHQASQGMSITPAGVQSRFAQTQGLDPIFRLIDGANSPKAAVGTLEEKRNAYSMLLNRGVIRVGLALPRNAEFSILKVEDPYNFASAQELSLFRRPLPSSNLRMNAAFMWDGRETLRDSASNICILNSNPLRCFAPLDVNLQHQANSAVRGHAEAAQDLTAAEQKAIVDFEKTLFTAQVSHGTAGSLNAANALGGPTLLALQPFYFGINDPAQGDYQTRAPFNRNVFNLFGAWRGLDIPRPRQAPPDAQARARASIARGEQIFNNKPFIVTRVGGLNQVPNTPQRASCAACHNAPNVGSHSTPRFFNTGVADGARRTPDMPLYTLKNNLTGETVQSTDPGFAMQSGRWQDIGRFKTPTLRALAARAPFFHDGSARNLEEVVQFYERRFAIGFTPQERADLTAFLSAL